MTKKKSGFGFSGSGEILQSVGLITAQQTSAPIDHQRAQEEQALEKKFGRDVFGAKIPEKYFSIFPDDSQAKLGTI